MSTHAYALKATRHNHASLLVRLAGIEPATFGFEVRRSIQLSYRRARTTIHQRVVPLRWRAFPLG